MKALILVGGFGTRLRPLTFSCPKPLVEFCNRPFIEHQIEALAKAGVNEIILAINYQPDAMKEAIAGIEKKFNVKIVCSQENEPMGTAGPIRLAKDIITKDNESGLFFVFNSDIICEFPLTDMIKFHQNHKQEGTIFVTEVQDPSKYGVIVAEEDGRIKQFVEKPQHFISNKINAGLYLFNTSVIDRIPLQPTSIEREIFPKMATDGQIYQLKLPGFWMDVGQPKDFLVGTTLLLEHFRKTQSTQLNHGENIIGNVLIDESAQIDKSCVIGPNVVIGKGCVINEGLQILFNIKLGCRLKNCIILNNSTIQQSSWICDTIIGWRSTVGKWVRIEGVSVCGEDVQIKDELFINGSFILPHRQITQSITVKGTVMM